MESKLELIEIGENHYAVKGKINSEIHTDQLKEDDWMELEIEIECLGLIYKIRDYSLGYDFGIQDTLVRRYSEQHNIHLSQNNEVALYQMLYGAGKLDKRIIDLFAGGSPSNQYHEKIKVSRFENNDGSITPVISINILKYGYGSYVTIFVGIETFFNLIKDKKLGKEKEEEAVDFFQEEYDVDIEKTDADSFVKLLYEINDYKKQFNELDRKKREIELEIDREQNRIAKEYFSKKYPFKKGDFIFNGRDDVFKLTRIHFESIDERYYRRKIKHPIERRFYSTVVGVTMTGSGESKKANPPFGSNLYNGHKFICSEEEYVLLAKQHKLPVKPNKNSLLTLLHKINPK